mmetsp:Transcript_8405/g.18401  ORF Transcript_8405/g.18401 Transcript_8405/m.18401 type:complete len:100 (+) Transcript_8405:229-528(+)
MVVSSNDSVRFGQVWKDKEENPIVTTIGPIVIDEISKLHFGPIKSISAEYENATIVHISIAPLVFTFVGTQSMNTDLLTTEDMYKKLELGFKSLQNACR